MANFAVFGKELNKLSNQLTLLRIFCVPVLWLLVMLQQSRLVIAFVAVFAYLTDVLDGFFARKLKQVSAFGERIDSFADNIIGFSAAIWLGLLFPTFFMQHFLFILIVLALAALRITLSYVKCGQMAHYHTYSGKAALVLGYGFAVHALLFGPNKIFFYCAIVSLAAVFIEECILIIRTSTKLS